jgi:prephenate dehydratase
MNKRISIQGFEGSFHQVAAQQFFGKETAIICCSTFKDVIKIAQNKKESEGGVMAIENSIVGSILPNYNLLQKSALKITGEVYLQINQHLMVNPGVRLEDIREVHSHPMAIQQCFSFLDKHEWKIIETEDTALSAKLIYQHRNKPSVLSSRSWKAYIVSILPFSLGSNICLKSSAKSFLIMKTTLSKPAFLAS